MKKQLFNYNWDSIKYVKDAKDIYLGMKKYLWLGEHAIKECSKCFKNKDGGEKDFFFS